MELGWSLVVPAYLLGTFPTAILVGQRRGHDVTQEGSGNPGASNTLRTMGPRAGAAVLAGDLGKGALAAAMGLATGDRAIGVACGLAAVLGHVAPVTRRFRGGKGVATAAGMAFVLVPLVALVLAGVWAIVVRLSRTASVGSVAISAGLPLGAALAGRPAGEVAAFAVCGALVVLRHRENLRRIRRGEERSLRPGA
ncbi:MAG TPA: glycerol-3-phosphate acyltransferase [Acidimicrobiales bacterium]|nr:glycerol-3-phosphate acyltransferase [Acidimicrobiales bacterium]